MRTLKITDDGTRAWPHYSIRQYERRPDIGWCWVAIAWAKTLEGAVDITKNMGAELHADSLTLDDRSLP